MYNSSNTASARLFISQRENEGGIKTNKIKHSREREKEAHTNNTHTQPKREYNALRR
jgi:hypothetical protein